MSDSQLNYTDFPDESQPFFNLLPAVVIGGPPHSGKSVLAYSLTQTLRAHGVPHYLLRAYPPDGEGDWFLSGELEAVRHFRVKGARSEAWLPLLQRDVARRHLPLLVDMGGLPTLQQEALLDSCTHGILLTPDLDSHAAWSACMERHGLILLADLHSALEGEDLLEAALPVVRGVLTGLERGSRAGGAAYDALVARLAQLFSYVGPEALRRRHLRAAPAEMVIDLERLAPEVGRAPDAWLPEDLTRLLDYLPRGEPLALYGRGPNWVYAAVAAQAQPAPFYLFDVRLGWVAVPALSFGTWVEGGPLACTVRQSEAGLVVDFRLPDAYLDLLEVASLPFPLPASEGGLILTGKLPHWLWGALARGYSRHYPWVAVFQPQLNGAVVVWSAVEGYGVGAVVEMAD